ncbi:fructose-6-phosphate aldolase [Candidatus Micrarchaeota archaeon]|nr:fructose-6-phosphate aldolase [Candidatus Micrarchaeota archaeon]
MKFFLDTADVDAIRKANELRMVDGITTNPTLIMKSGKNHREVIGEISKIIKGPISVEGVGLTFDEMVSEAENFVDWIPNAVIKVPMTKEGLRTASHLESRGIPVNVTLVFSPSQALLAAKTGASYVSPFVGRLDDIGQNGMKVVDDIVRIFSNYKFKTEVIVASVRSVSHVVEAAKIGAHIATIPPKIYEEMWNHELTDKGIKKFLDDYKKSKA